MHKPPFKYEAYPDHFRVSDANDDRVATCFLEANARKLVKLLNDRAALLRALETLVKAAGDAYEHWNNDRDAKVGKLLLALSGHLPEYRAELAAAHAALAEAQKGV